MHQQSLVKAIHFINFNGWIGNFNLFIISHKFNLIRESMMDPNILNGKGCINDKNGKIIPLIIFLQGMYMGHKYSTY